MSIVYDQAPAVTYDPLHPMGSGGDFPPHLGTPPADQAQRDDRAAHTGQQYGRTVWHGRPYAAGRIRETAPAGFGPGIAPEQPRPASGFGDVRPVRMLVATPRQPWLTPDLVYQELAIGEYQRDRAAVAMDSI